MKRKQSCKTVRLTTKAANILNQLKRVTGMTKQAIVERSVAAYEHEKESAK
jgi:hypothetical protein